jgi:hypothetical protein
LNKRGIMNAIAVDHEGEVLDMLFSVGETRRRHSG